MYYLFVHHISNHLKSGERVICKICDKDVATIFQEERPDPPTTDSEEDIFIEMLKSLIGRNAIANFIVENTGTKKDETIASVNLLAQGLLLFLDEPITTDVDNGVVKEFKEVEELFPGCEIIHSQEMEDNFREEEENEVSEPVRSQADERVMMGNQIWYCEVCHFWGVVDWEDGEDVMSVTNRVEKAHKLHGCHNPIRQVRIIREGYPFPKPKDPVIDTDKEGA